MTSKLGSLTKTFTFRLALVYVGLFSISVISLFGFIYTFAMNYLQTQITDHIRMQYTYLIEEYRQSGSTGLEARIKELIANDSDGNEIYLLVNNKEEKLAGNLNTWPVDAKKESSFEKEGNWVNFRIEGGVDSVKGIEVKALTIPISKWRSLLVGQSLESNERIEQTIIQTFWASLLLTLFMAFTGAIIITRSVMRRINVISRSAYTIMHGNVSVRIPYNAGGDEFDDLSFNLNQMLDKIETLLLTLSQFANNIAHDLRSPLNRIINRLDAGLRNIGETNPARKLLEKNIQDMHDLIGTFNSILKISELEAGTESHLYEDCDLSEILGNLIEFYEPYAAEKETVITSRLTRQSLVKGEKNLLMQAFANLLDNAIKFTGSGGKITITVEKNNSEAHVLIADNGPGIPEEYRSRVFEKFFRLEQSRNTKGNGLGLSLVSAIARIHNASISLEDNNPGLRVRFIFPSVLNVE